MLFGIIPCISLKLLNKKNNIFIYFIVKLSSIILIVFITLCLFVSLKLESSNMIFNYIFTFKNLLQEYRENTLNFIIIIPYIITSIVIISTLIISCYISIKRNSPLLITLIFCFLLSHFSMLVSPYSPLRSTYIPIMFLWVSISYLISIAYEDDIYILPISISIIAIYNLNFGILCIIISLIIHNIFFKNKNLAKLEIILLSFLLSILCLTTYIKTLDNYIKNKMIYNKNINSIITFKKNLKNNPNLNEIYLLSPADKLYGFTPLVGTEWVEKNAKKYFGINDNVLFVVKD